MTVGACTWVFGDAELGRVADRCRELGLDCVELLADIERVSAAEVRATLQPRGISVASLTPINVDIAHADPPIREAGIDYYRRLIAFAASVGAPAVTCHEFVGRTRPHDDTASEWRRLVAACRQFAVVGQREGIDILFEPLNATLVSSAASVERVLTLVEQVGSPRFRIVLDTYHLFLQERDPVRLVEKCLPFLGAVQLADGQRLGLGRGGYDLVLVLAVLVRNGFAGPWILECTPELTGPRLDNPSVDLVALERELRASVDYLRAVGCVTSPSSA